MYLRCWSFAFASRDDPPAGRGHSGSCRRSSACTGLQWVHSDRCIGSACSRFGRSGSRSNARPSATNSNPLSRPRLMPSRSVMPPSSTSGRSTVSRTWRAGPRAETSVRTGTRAASSCRTDGPRSASACGIAAAKSRIGTSPWNRYIGLSSELPSVNSIASSVPSWSSQPATRIDSVRSNPPGTPSSMLSLAMIAYPTTDPSMNLGHHLVGQSGPVLLRLPP